MAKQSTLRINWCFTINNFTQEDIVNLKLLFDSKVCSYIVFGEEVGTNNTPHLQGFIQFTNKKRLTSIKKIKPFEKAHLEPMMAKKPIQAAMYCKKDNKFTELGVMTTAGQRNDVVECANIFRKKRSFTEMQGEPVWFQYQRAITKQIDEEDRELCINNQRKVYSGAHLRRWQAELAIYLSTQPHERKVLWYYEEYGNSGKSWFSRWLVLNMNAIRFENGKSADIKYGYSGQRVVVFDFTRKTEDRINYEVIESIKNGIYFNTKYTSGMRVYPHPHLICLANFLPDKSALSEDRWDIYRITVEDQEPCLLTTQQQVLGLIKVR